MKQSHTTSRAGVVGTTKPLTLAKLDAMPLTHGATTEDGILAAQLTDQYHRATGGMREVLIFGAMMIKLEQTLSARGHSGHGIKGQGVKGWLEEHAPQVERGTAYRFKGVAESVRAEYTSLPKKMDFIQIATAPTHNLHDKEQKAQQQLFDFVNGTSQRSWLDKFKPARETPNNGGDVTPRDENGKRIKKDKRTKAQIAEDDRQVAAELWLKQFAAAAHIGLLKKHYVRGDHAALAKLHTELLDLREEIQTHLQAVEKKGKK